MSLVSTAYDKYRRDGLVSLVTSGTVHLRAEVKSTYLSLTGGTITSHGVTLDLNNDALDTRTKRGFFEDSFEKPELDLIDRFIDGGDVVELGAGIGFVSCYVNDRIGEQDTHVAVEANENLIPTLHENKRLNECTFQVEHAAYAPEGGIIDFHLQDQYPSGSVRDERGEESSVRVEATTVETLATENDLDEFTLLADIEGSETDLVRSELEFLEQNCRRIVVEFHSFVPRHEYERALAALESSAFALEERRSKQNDEYDDYRIYRNTDLE